MGEVPEGGEEFSTRLANSESDIKMIALSYGDAKVTPDGVFTSFLNRFTEGTEEERAALIKIAEEGLETNSCNPEIREALASFLDEAEQMQDTPRGVVKSKLNDGSLGE